MSLEMSMLFIFQCSVHDVRRTKKNKVLFVANCVKFCIEADLNPREHVLRFCEMPPNSSGESLANSHNAIRRILFSKSVYQKPFMFSLCVNIIKGFFSTETKYKLGNYIPI